MRSAGVEEVREDSENVITYIGMKLSKIRCKVKIYKKENWRCRLFLERLF